MHVGNLRSALYAYLIARHDNGKFILRLEDTDQDHYLLGAEELIYKILDRFSLLYDDYGPYVQSERLPI